MIHIDNGPVKQRQSQQLPKEPDQYALVMNVMHGSDPVGVVAFAVHLLRDHFGIPKSEGKILTLRAIANGKTPVKVVTKDVGETLLAGINACPLHSGYNDVRVTLELN